MARLIDFMENGAQKKAKPGTQISRKSQSVAGNLALMVRQLLSDALVADVLQHVLHLEQQRTTLVRLPVRVVLVGRE